MKDKRGKETSILGETRTNPKQLYKTCFKKRILIVFHNILPKIVIHHLWQEKWEEDTRKLEKEWERKKKGRKMEGGKKTRKRRNNKPTILEKKKKTTLWANQKMEQREERAQRGRSSAKSIIMVILIMIW